MKNKATNIIIVLLFIAGIAFVFYPVITSSFYTQNSNEVIKEFKETAETIRGKDSSNEDDVSATSDDKSGTGDDDFGITENNKSEQNQSLYADMQAYNREIYENGQIGLQDPFVFEIPAFDLTSYGFQSNVAGYIEIPKLDVELPIYFGATAENMALGAVSLAYTSTPIGGENTNTVLAAHRGYGAAAMFRDIEAIEVGDKIYITNLWETLTYQVTETKVILPTDVQEVCIQEGRDMLTLITCHPYTKNYQRYVVYCDRIYENEQEDEQLNGQVDRQIDGQKDQQVNKEKDIINTGLEIKYLFKLDELSDSQRLIFAEKWIPIGIAILLLLLILIRTVLWGYKKIKAHKSTGC